MSDIGKMFGGVMKKMTGKGSSGKMTGGQSGFGRSASMMKPETKAGEGGPDAMGANHKKKRKASVMGQADGGSANGKAGGDSLG